MRFVDHAVITVESGKGGHGCVSFRREAHVPKGGPDGGNGGKGGDIIFEASDKLLTLYDFRLKRLYKAGNGHGGMGKQRHGKNADDLIIKVPVGTQIYGQKLIYEESEEKTSATATISENSLIAHEEKQETAEEEPEQLLADLTRPGEQITVCRGGRGGKGNEHFKSSTMRTPRFAQKGETGKAWRIRLELKILAHAGLLGLPSAGKSTLLSVISAAKPKIAPYPFTTLSPNLGVLISPVGEHFVVADIPGLIEGAHKGQGLGHQFLRHVERNKFLIHLMGADDISLDDPFAGFDLLNEELALYSPDLAKKKQVLVINKIDLLDEQSLALLQEKAKEKKKKILFISALTGQGIGHLLKVMWKLYRQITSGEDQ